MPITVDRIDVSRGESLFVNIDGSSEVMLTIVVGKDGRCFVSGPFNTNAKFLELSVEGLTESTQEQRDRAFNS